MFRKLRFLALTTFLSCLFWIEKTFASKALTELETGATKLSTIVAGPLGKTVLIVGTLVGVFSSLQRGNVMGAVAILIIGVLVSWQIADILKVFA